MEAREPSGKVEDENPDKPCPWAAHVVETLWAIRRLPRSERHSIPTEPAAILVMQSIESDSIEPPRVQSVQDPRMKGRYGITLSWQRENRRVVIELFDGHRTIVWTKRGREASRCREYRSVLPTRDIRQALAWMNPGLFTPKRYLEWCE